MKVLNLFLLVVVVVVVVGRPGAGRKTTPNFDDAIRRRQSAPASARL